jgi:ectoine hydroxylase-related dioxygenase (phytanoyl-CoA dioxygenase family)
MARPLTSKRGKAPAKAHPAASSIATVTGNSSRNTSISSPAPALHLWLVNSCDPTSRSFFMSMRLSKHQVHNVQHPGIRVYSIIVSIYISLDTADSDVAVRFVKGSHRWNKLYHPRVFEDGSNLNDDLGLAFEEVPDIDANSDEFDIVAESFEPGDTILFDYRTLHGTSDAEIKNTRRAFSTRWMGDDVTYCERSGETSPPYTDHGMKHADRMREDWFPVLWRNE